MNKLLRILTIALVLMSVNASAQFYNGHQMDFGKNRVQYSEFEWMFYRYPKFDTYYYQQGKDIAQYTCDRATEIIPEMEKYFGKSLSRRIVFIVFNRIEEFRQSNIGLETNNSQSNLGGVVKIMDNKVFLYFDGDHNRYTAQIREAVAQILMNVSINGSGIKNKVSSSSSMTLPEWYSKGLSFYAANQWNAEIEDVLKDGFESRRYRKLQFLQGEDAKYAGYSMWYFINRNYGRDAVSSILYLTGINKDCNLAFNQVLNQKFRKLNKQWLAYYRDKFGLEDGKGEISSAQNNDAGIIGKYRRNTIYDKPMQSPDGRYTFYATDKEGKIKAMLVDNESHKQIKILRRGQPLEQEQEHNYPVAAWHPTGRILTFVIEEQGYVYMYQYNVETAALSRRLLSRFDKVFSIDYSDDGLDLVMSVQWAGMTDILVMNIASGAFENITQDQADDINPRFIENGSKIIFASNRLKDTLRTEKVDDHDKFGKTYDIFVYDYKNRSNVLKRITDTKYENETSPFELSANSYTYLSDKSGIVNRYASVYDSTIIAIDTAVHYSYTNRYSHVSDFEHNARSMNLNKERRSIDLSFRNKGKYLMRRESLDADRSNLPAELPTTYFRQILNKRQDKQDSLDAARARKAAEERRRTDSIVANPPKNLKNPDSLKYDILNYYFEEEKSLAHQLIFYGEDIKARHAREKAERPNQRMYFTNFYTDYLVSQVDFSTLSEGYQAYTGGPYYFDPGASVFMKVGCKDLFEDYRLTAAFRMGGNLKSYEYLLCFEDLKHRLDKQYIFHRSTYNEELGYAVGKVISNEAMFVAKYPFTQTSAVKGTLGLRYDKAQYQVTDVQYLDQKPQHQIFAKAKAEYIFDNTRAITTNIQTGVKFKGWSELYQQLDGNYDIISSWGFDFRYYQRIHRCMIFASRLAGATSFGSGKILYYLGGVDNWQTFSSDQSKRFDQSVRVDPDANYIYQAVGTNMRGFIQNCRNGNTFAVINNEIRFPVFRYLFNRPINRKMINDFQVVGFCDAGSAWTGLVPGHDNAYNKYEVTDGSITMIMDVARPTMVVGYGVGLRTTLLGYFLRLDWAWGLEGKVILPRTFYFSLGFDF